MVKSIKKEKKIVKPQWEDASAPRRFISYIIDWYVGALATSLPISIIAKKLYGTMLSQDILNFDQPYGLIGGILGIVCALVYYVVIPLGSNKGQTLGKRICKIKIIQENGEDVTMKNILLRQVLGIIIIEGSLVSVSAIWQQVIMILTGIDILTPLKYVGIALGIISSLMILFMKDHRAIHDYLGKTRVISCQ